MYISQCLYLELGLKPDLVFNPSLVVFTNFQFVFKLSIESPSKLLKGSTFPLLLYPILLLKCNFTLYTFHCYAPNKCKPSIPCVRKGALSSCSAEGHPCYCLRCQTNLCMSCLKLLGT